MTAFLAFSAIQGFFILFDELFFHRKRGLPRWERVGHPIDTATVIVCLLFLYFTAPTPTTTVVYYVLAVISCLCVTKDEYVHWKYCGPGELWLHSVLFLLHPVVLFTATRDWTGPKENLLMVAGFVGMFFVYQVIYWNFVEGIVRKTKQEARYRHISKEDLYEYFGE